MRGRSEAYKGEITTDHYGRRVPKHAHGTANLEQMTSSTRLIMDAVTALYERIVDKKMLVRRINVTANHLIDESTAQEKGQDSFIQMDLFTDYEDLEKQKKENEAFL